MPTAEQLQVMPRRSLYQWLRIGGDDLRQDLARFGNGEEWAGYFRLDELRETIAEESEIAPYVAHQRKWQRLWRTYVGISEDSKYKRIQRMIGFQLIDSTLAELIKPAERRDRIRLVISARELNQALDSIPNGAGWKRYLALPDEEVKKPELSISEGSIPRNVAKLRMVESRFDSIRNNPKYRALAEWPTFQAAHQNLSTYLDHLVDAQAIPHLAHD